jgi:hypothetical protein
MNRLGGTSSPLSWKATTAPVPGGWLATPSTPADLSWSSDKEDHRGTSSCSLFSVTKE